MLSAKCPHLSLSVLCIKTCSLKECAARLATSKPRPSSLSPQCWDCRHSCYMPVLLHMCWGFKVRLLCLHRKHSYPLSHLSNHPLAACFRFFILKQGLAKPPGLALNLWFFCFHLPRSYSSGWNPSSLAWILFFLFMLKVVNIALWQATETSQMNLSFLGKSG